MHIPKSIENKKWWWIVAILLVILIKIFSLNSDLVERYYTYGLYPVISNTLSFLFGWIPFSIGDILYILAGVWILYAVIKNIILLFKRGFIASHFFSKVLNTLLILTFIYIIFNIFWGINYNRKGLADQLNFSGVTYDTTDLLAVNDLLISKVNLNKRALNHLNRPFPATKELFRRSGATFKEAAKKYPFLDYHYSTSSVKSSMYGWLGNYLGFTGYYNPFTGEAQANITVPSFLQPYIVNHEIGHQLGYAKEDEASFAGYLAILHSNDTLFKYSAYLDLFAYANSEVYYVDSNYAKNSFNRLDSSVLKDLQEWKDFTRSHQSFLAPVITWMYSKYLKFNEQPQGMRSYNRVIVMLLAYYKNYGEI